MSTNVSNVSNDGNDGNDSNDSNECSICLESINLPVTTNCNHNFCYLCLKGVSQTSSQMKCPLCRTPITVDLNNVSVNEDLVTELADIDLERGFVWQYSGRNHGWWNYDIKTNREIEDFYMDYVLRDDDSISSAGVPYIVTVGYQEYELDFEEMKQKSVLHPGRMRQIKRVSKKTKNTKGTAGIKYYVP